jgi:S-adenosylmethionine decarboxylase
MQGLHLTADLCGCPPAQPAMTDPAALRKLCLAAVAEVGLQAVGDLFHRFQAAADQAEDSAGVTGVVLLAESHLAIHTWPELAAVTLDVYVCNLGQDNSERAEALMARLQQAFGAEKAECHRLQRGGSLLQTS